MSRELRAQAKPGGVYHLVTVAGITVCGRIIAGSWSTSTSDPITCRACLRVWGTKTIKQGGDT